MVEIKFEYRRGCYWIEYTAISGKSICVPIDDAKELSRLCTMYKLGKFYQEDL